MNPIAWTPRLIVNIIGLLVLAIAIGWGITKIMSWREDMIAAQAQLADAQEIMTSTAKEVAVLQEIRDERTTSQQAIRNNRSHIESRVEELKNANPTVAEYLARPIPLELRQLDEKGPALDGPAAAASRSGGAEPGY